jgi:hypothetical protein
MNQRFVVAGLLCIALMAFAPANLQRTGGLAKAAPQVGAVPRAPAFGGTKRALILCGHPGDKAHRKPFAESVEKIRDALIERYQFAANDIHVQFGGPVADGEGPVLSGVGGQSSREEIEAEAAELRKVLRPDDALWVIVIGHSHYDGKHSWFNIPGPDINQQEFGKLFAGLECREQVFFITIPASGYYIKPLAAKGRVVISATEADLEVNETLFPLALAEVLATPPEPADLDVDHDGNLTLFDLYIAIAKNVAERYVSDEALPTEHSLIDDNGDGRGTEVQIDYLTEKQGGRLKEGKSPPPLRENADGTFSSRIILPPPPVKPAAVAPPAATPEAN